MTILGYLTAGVIITHRGGDDSVPGKCFDQHRVAGVPGLMGTVKICVTDIEGGMTPGASGKELDDPAHF